MCPWLRSFSGRNTWCAGCFADTIELQKGVLVPCGIRDTVIANSSIAGSAYVASTSLLANAIVLEGAAIVGCGVVACNGPTSFGNGMKLPLGLDGHGRESLVFASITVPEAAAAAQHTVDATAYAAFVTSVAESVKRSKSVFWYVLDAAVSVLRALMWCALAVGGVRAALAQRSSTAHGWWMSCWARSHGWRTAL